ncbi:MAG TPA: DUF3892 domain-containing protein [Coriobacteriia bacterium]|nr:DUF3892 domain-containing protein [Coriobacteriia bacterium]
MSVRITAIRLSQGGYTHEHITDVKWTSYENDSSGQSTKAATVEWIDNGGAAYVESASTKVQVGVVKPQGGTPYLRTYANGTWTDNLLSLPRF